MREGIGMGERAGLGVNMLAHATIVGLCMDVPRLRYLDDRTALCSFRLGVYENLRPHESAGGPRWGYTMYLVNVLRDKAERVARVVRQDDLLFVQGRLLLDRHESGATGIRVGARIIAGAVRVIVPVLDGRGPVSGENLVE